MDSIQKELILKVLREEELADKELEERLRSRYKELKLRRVGRPYQKIKS